MLFIYSTILAEISYIKFILFFSLNIQIINFSSNNSSFKIRYIQRKPTCLNLIPFFFSFFLSNFTHPVLHIKCAYSLVLFDQMVKILHLYCSQISINFTFLIILSLQNQILNYAPTISLISLNTQNHLVLSNSCIYFLTL